MTAIHPLGDRPTHWQHPGCRPVHSPLGVSTPSGRLARLRCPTLAPQPRRMMLKPAAAAPQPQAAPRAAHLGVDNLVRDDDLPGLRPPRRAHDGHAGDRLDVGLHFGARPAASPPAPRSRRFPATPAHPRARPPLCRVARPARHPRGPAQEGRRGAGRGAEGQRRVAAGAGEGGAGSGAAEGGAAPAPPGGAGAGPPPPPRAARSPIH